MTPDAGLVSGHTGSSHWLTPSKHLYVQSLFVPPHTPSLNIPYVWHCPTYPVCISQICMFLLFLSSWWLQSLGWPFPNLYLQFLNSPSITDKRLLVFGIVSVIPCLPGLCLYVSSFIAFPYIYYRLLYWQHPWSDQLQEADTLTFQIPLQFIFWSCSLSPSIYRCFKILNFCWQYSYLEAGLQADSLKTKNPLGHPPKKLQFAYKCFS